MQSLSLGFQTFHTWVFVLLWNFGLFSTMDTSKTGPFCSQIHENWWEHLTGFIPFGYVLLFLSVLCTPLAFNSVNIYYYVNVSVNCVCIGGALLVWGRWTKESLNYLVFIFYISWDSEHRDKHGFPSSVDTDPLQKNGILLKLFVFEIIFWDNF